MFKLIDAQHDDVEDMTKQVKEKSAKHKKK